MSKNVYTETLQQLSRCLVSTLDIHELNNRCESVLQQVLDSTWISILPAGAVAPAATLAAPVVLDGATIATIYAGEKSSGETYTPEENNLLGTFALQAAPAFSHAILYSRVRTYAGELEERVAARTEEIQKLQEQQQQLMIDISHNLQTPIALFQIKLEQQKATTTDGAAIESLEQSLNDMSLFIHNFLRLAHMEHTAGATPTPLNVSVLLGEVVEEVEIIAADQAISVESDVQPEMYISGTKAELREAILELTSNSIKYMRPKGVRHILFSLQAKEKEAVLIITDTGVGISPDDVSHMFDRFWRAKHAGGVTGSGLGLALVKHIIERHGGTIAAESEVRVGTRMVIRLPLLNV